MKRKLTALLCLVLSLMCAIPAVSFAEAPIELTYYFPTQTAGPMAIAMEEIVNAFNETHPGIHVTATFAGNYEDTLQKTLTAITGNNAPNIVLLSNNIAPLLETDELVDLNTLIAKEPEDFLEDYVPGFFTLYQYPGDKLWGMPFQHSATLFYYNKDLFAAAGLDPENPPKTWSELEAAAQAIKSFDSSIIPLEFMGDAWMMEALTLANGGAIHKDFDNMWLDNAELIETIGFFKKLMDAGLAEDNKSYGGASENFMAGISAMMTNTSGSLGNISNTATFNWDIALLPTGEGKDGAAVLGGGGFQILKNHPQEEIDASWEFVKYMTSPEVSAKWMLTSGYFAVRYSSYDLPEIQERFATKPQYRSLMDYLPVLQTPYLIRENQTDIQNVLVLALDECFLNNANIAATMQQAQIDAQGYLTK